MRHALLLLVAAVALLGALALKGSLLTLPSPASNDFDGPRAAARLQRILGDERPHPVDSAAGDAVRARLIAEMRAVGLNPRVTDDFTCNSAGRNRTVSCARVRNLVATLGPAEGRHVLLVSHYDSTPTGPGASDDGIGVATMLEIAARLRGTPLSRPVTFLIDEGEEMGLLGARAFLERDPLRGRVDTLINLESRGVTGPAIMFETSRPNGPAIALYRAAAARPVANSLSTDLYRLIPNSTDVSVFNERPWTILNFAVIGNETRYHSQGDRLAALDRHSLQHMGDQALAVTRVAAAGAPPASGELLYMDVLGRWLVVLPLLLGLVLLAILVLFFLLESWRRRALGRPLLAMAVALGGSAALAFLGHLIVHWLRPGDYWRAYPLVTTTAVYASALAAAALALRFVAGSAERTRLRAAFWLAFTLLGAAICLIAPGAAIYFLLPPLAMGFGISGRRWFASSERNGALLAILFLYLSFGPALGLFEELMNDDPQWIFAALGAAILLPALIELMPLLKQLRPRPALICALGPAGAGWLAAALTPAYSDDKQQLFTIEYVWDEDARSGRFAVNNDGAPVPYSAAWQRVEMPYTTRRRWAAPAPASPVSAPTATLVADRVTFSGRRLRVRLAANGAETVALIAPTDARVVSGGSGGFVRPLGHGARGDKYVLRCAGRACDGAELEIAMGDRRPLELTIVGTRSGLPPAAAPLARARPAHARAQYGPDATIAIGRARF